MSTGSNEIQSISATKMHLSGPCELSPLNHAQLSMAIQVSYNLLHFLLTTQTSHSEGFEEAYQNPIDLDCGGEGIVISSLSLVPSGLTIVDIENIFGNDNSDSACTMSSFAMVVSTLGEAYKFCVESEDQPVKMPRSKSEADKAQQRNSDENKAAVSEQSLNSAKSAIPKHSVQGYLLLEPQAPVQAHGRVYSALIAAQDFVENEPAIKQSLEQIQFDNPLVMASKYEYMVRAVAPLLETLEYFKTELFQINDYSFEHFNKEVRKPPEFAVFRDRLRDGSVAPKMVVLPAGRFLMGSEEDEGRDDEKPLHEVILPTFSIGKYALTFEEYDRFARATGREMPSDSGWGRGRRPVINVNWFDAKAYCDWLSMMTGKHYRLPSEAEWEYACRAGSVEKYATGNTITTEQANFDGNKTLSVGRYPANPWGLCDMHGNVWEWVEDDWHKDYSEAPADGSAWVDGSDVRVLRGGSWLLYDWFLRSAIRDAYGPVGRFNRAGFRLAQEL